MASLLEVLEKYGRQCFLCGDVANQRAHIIGNTKTNKKIYGSAIIGSIYNMLPACSLRCNALIDCGHSSSMPDVIAGMIKNKDVAGIKSKVTENIRRKCVKIQKH